MKDKKLNTDLIREREEKWNSVLLIMKNNPDLKSHLQDWWDNLVNKHEGISEETRATHRHSFDVLMNMEPEGINKMLLEYEMGDYPNSENLERESLIHLFLAIIGKHHNLW